MLRCPVHPLSTYILGILPIKLIENKKRRVSGTELSRKFFEQTEYARLEGLFFMPVGVDVAEAMLLLLPAVCDVCCNGSAATVNNHLCS